MLNIENIRHNLRYGGARTSLFQVKVFGPIAGVQNFQFLCSASSIPGGIINPIELKYMGRTMKLAGQSTFEDWTVTIINDEDFRIRKAFEAWQQDINHKEQNVRIPAYVGQGYKANAHVVQFGKDGSRLHSYSVEGIWPQNLSPIELNWEADTIQTYTVSFAVDFWKSGIAE